MLQLKIDLQGQAPQVEWSDANTRIMLQCSAYHLRDLIRQHLEAKPGRQYYKKAASTIETEVGPNDAAVHVQQKGIRLRFYGTAGLPGGVLKATGRPSAFTGKPTKMLLIPAPDSPMRLSYSTLDEVGISPANVFVLKKNGKALLMANTGEDKPRLLGTLKASVTQKPDPTVLPTTEQMQKAIHEGMEQGFNMISMFNR